MANSKKIYFNAETFNVESLDGEQPKIILSGLAMPFEKMSRNGVKYRTESVKKAYDSLKNAAFLFNHDTNRPLGHVAESGISADGMTYKADLDPQEEYFRKKVERGDIRHVSIGALVENPEYEDDGSVTVDVTEFVELSLVPVPGFKDATASVGLEGIQEASPLMIAEAFGNKKMVKKLQEKAKKKEDDEVEDPDKDKDDDSDADKEEPKSEDDKELEIDEETAQEKEFDKKKEELEPAVIKMNEILFIRVLEIFNEGKFEDAQLHEFVQKVEEALKTKDFLTMEDYDSICSDLMTEKKEGIDTTPTPDQSDPNKDQEPEKEVGTDEKTPAEKGHEAVMKEMQGKIEELNGRVSILESRLDANEEEENEENEKEEEPKEDPKDEDHPEPDEDNKGGPSDNDADNEGEDKKDGEDKTDNAESDETDDEDEDEEKEEKFERVGNFAPIKLDYSEKEEVHKIDGNELRLRNMSY